MSGGSRTSSHGPRIEEPRTHGIGEFQNCLKGRLCVRLNGPCGPTWLHRKGEEDALACLWAEFLLENQRINSNIHYTYEYTYIYTCCSQKVGYSWEYTGITVDPPMALLHRASKFSDGLTVFSNEKPLSGVRLRQTL
jgi:hypothetical protein